MRSELNQNPIDVSKDFSIDGRIIRVNSRLIRPPFIGPYPNNPIVFIPGWGNNANSRSARVVGQAFAEKGRREVIIIDTKPNNILDGSLLAESAAVAQFLEERGVESTTVVGYSEGGIKAAYLVVALQKSEVEIEGVVFMGTAGLYKRKQVDPVKAFVRHGIKNIKGRYGKQKVDVSKDQKDQGLIAGQIDEIKRTKFNYPRRLAYQVREISRKNARLKEITVPVVLINGAEDLISEPEMFLPGFRNLNQHEREAALKRTIFQSSPYVRFITGEKPPLHTLPVLEPSKVARVSLGLIERSHR